MFALKTVQIKHASDGNQGCFRRLPVGYVGDIFDLEGIIIYIDDDRAELPRHWISFLSNNLTHTVMNKLRLNYSNVIAIDIEIVIAVVITIAIVIAVLAQDFSSRF